eukprot:TRINITY_DN10298_c0_g1_i1.p1 TRINITY_DN10298_c0_g1~~TRINITY_DN10298_c0_g1_i1.p1  ORF type:complete len:306 (+),score=15.68 TRINITY_DN10298_c0_g1_i1:59-976(+)
MKAMACQQRLVSQCAAPARLAPSTAAPRVAQPTRSATIAPLRASLKCHAANVGRCAQVGAKQLAGHVLRTPEGAASNAEGRRGGRRGVVTMVIPFQKGEATQQPPPDLPSYLFKNRIVFLGMSLVPAVTELIMAELLYLQYDSPDKPIYMYINSTGTTKDGEKLGYETEAFAIYDTMRYVKPPIFTLCVGNAWGEAALLLAAGSKGNRSALPSSTIMLKQPISRFRGQATDIDIMRKEVRNVKTELVSLYARHTKRTAEQIEEDIRRPMYLSPDAAVEYGIIDKVLQTDSANESVVDSLKKRQLI